MGGPEIDEVRDKLGVSQIKGDKVDFDGIIDVVDSHGDPYIVMKQIVHFQDMAEIVAKLSSQIETMQAKIDKLEGKPGENTGRKEGAYPEL